MAIPLLQKEDVEEENIEKEGSARKQMIDFMKERGYTHLTTENEKPDETCDFFIKGEELIEVTIMNGIPEDVLVQMIEGTQY